MELLKIVGGLTVIAVFLVLFGTGSGGEEETAEAAAAEHVPGERSFSARDSSARFVVAPTE